MSKEQKKFSAYPPYIKALADRVVTIITWLYFTLGFIFFFSPFYLYSYFFSGNREASFQKLNCIFYKYMFILLQKISPGLSICIAGEVPAVRSSIIVCNHLSYLDSILLVSLYEKQKTIVKSRFFKVPVFGQVIRASGYLPSSAGGSFDEMLITGIEGMAAYLAEGGNLFVFPEGTRSRDGKMGHFNKGVFKIAKHCRAPVKVLRIRNSDKLFRPGKFLFNTCVPNRITVELAGDLYPDYGGDGFTVSGLTAQVKSIIAGRDRDGSGRCEP